MGEVVVVVGLDHLSNDPAFEVVVVADRSPFVQAECSYENEDVEVVVVACNYLANKWDAFDVDVVAVAAAVVDVVETS